jgi:RNA polymerase sigma-70 factor (ECF subfamily)
LAESFDQVFRDSYRDLVRVVSPIVGSVPDGEAVVQDAFLKAFVRWRRISRYDRPGAWVRRVAIRDAVRVAGRRRRQPELEPPPDIGVERTVIDRLDIARVLEVLPARQRACVVLHYLADEPVAAVATALGCRESTVRVHLHRARATLASALTPAPDTPDAKEPNDVH